MANPFNFGTPVPYHKFVGRWNQIKAIAEDLANSEGHSHAVIGGRRFGKSSFLEALQHVLIEQLGQTDSGDWYVFPLLINLKRLEDISAEGVFGLILSTLYQYFTSKRLRNELGITFEFDVANTKLGAFAKAHRNMCPLQEFEGIIDEFLDIFTDAYSFLRLVLLMDEAEAVVNQEWTEALFDKLRSLVYEGVLRKYVRLVIAGSSEITEVRQSGSPLFNMLKLTYLEAFSKEDILEIIGWAEDVPQTIADAVFQQCGGHPFIAQYLMHYVWEAGVSSATEDVIRRLAEKFKHERHADLYRWQHEIGTSGQFAYKFLEEQEEWATEEQIRKLVSDPTLPIDLSLVALCHHGLAIHDGTWRRYRYSGDLFKSWFKDNVLPSLATQQSQTDKLPSETQIKDPKITIHFKDQIFPTVYCYSLTAQEYTLVTCKIDNADSGCADCRVSVEAEIQGYSDPCSDTVEIPSGRTKTIALLPTITHEARLTLNEIHKTECRVIVRKHEKTGSGVLLDKTYPLRLHAADTALLAILKPGGSIEDLTDYLSVFVTPHEEKVKEVLTLTRKKANMVGYQGNPADARQITRSQAKAYFETLQEKYDIQYSSASLNFGKIPGQFTQRVRLPKDTLKEKSANCIDGTVLFASLLQLIGVEPFLVIVPGHAFVGWRIWRGSNDYDFLETTVIGSSTFENALSDGYAQYKHAMDNGYNLKTLFVDAQFIKLVDVAACRGKGIDPLL